MQSFKIGERTVASDHSEIQDILAEAHARRVRPRCLCTSPAPDMYVAQVDGIYVVKRMPNSAAQHHSDCSSFEPPPELSGRGEVIGSAIRTDPDDEAANLLRFDFALTSTSRRAPAPGEAGDPSSVKANPAKLSLRGLLHFLWDDAGLTRWTPGMAGRRNWSVVRRLLLAAAAKSHTSDTEMSKILLVPETFYLERKDEIQHQTRAYMRSLAPAGRKVPLGILVAELKSIEPATYGQKFVFKHLPHMPVFVDQDAAARFERLNAATLAMADTIGGARTIAICTFSRHPSGYSELREIATMPVNEHWMPFEHEREAALLAALDADRRAYQKMLRFNLGSSAPIASALLTDTRPEPVALFCPSEQISDRDLEQMRDAVTAGTYPGWMWGRDDAAMPELPGE